MVILRCMLNRMSDITQILAQIAQGDARATDELLQQVYHELRRLAAAKMAHEKPGQTLNATALVHEAYLRLVGQAVPTAWQNHRHFLAAAAEAMRGRRLRSSGGATRSGIPWMNSRSQPTRIMKNCSHSAKPSIASKRPIPKRPKSSSSATLPA